MGRSGHMFAWEEYGIRPDIMTVAKALGCGVPVGAVMMTEKVAQHSLVPGDHGTTYGGNPFVGAAVSAVQDIFREDHIVEHVAETAPYLEAELEALVRKHDCLVERRGKGFLQGAGGRSGETGAGHRAGGHHCRQRRDPSHAAADHRERTH